MRRGSAPSRPRRRPRRGTRRARRRRRRGTGARARAGSRPSAGARREARASRRQGGSCVSRSPTHPAAAVVVDEQRTARLGGVGRHVQARAESPGGALDRRLRAVTPSIVRAATAAVLLRSSSREPSGVWRSSDITGSSSASRSRSCVSRSSCSPSSVRGRPAISRLTPRGSAPSARITARSTRSLRSIRLTPVCSAGTIVAETDNRRAQRRAAAGPLRRRPRGCEAPAGAARTSPCASCRSRSRAARRPCPSGAHARTTTLFETARSPPAASSSKRATSSRPGGPEHPNVAYLPQPGR